MQWTLGELLKSYMDRLNEINPEDLVNFLSESARAWFDNQGDPIDPLDAEFLAWLNTLPTSGELLDRAS